METYVNIFEPSFLKAALCIFLAPVIWNALARIEYYTHLLTKIACGSAYIGCYLLAAWIFGFSSYRDIVFAQALEKQPTLEVLGNPLVTYAAYALLAAGGILVITSMYQLGVTGTFLGDYFGILMEDRVTAFPYNVTNNPMYDGAVLNFLGLALLGKSPAGILLTLEVLVMYRIALSFEEPFTGKIYAEREEKRKKARSTKTKKDD